MKPVAWMSPDGKLSTTEGKLFYIPLYTAPRELSDEEIRQIYIETMESPYTHQQSYFGFARAILKKASEK
jgi:hypothetical protein